MKKLLAAVPLSLALLAGPALAEEAAPKAETPATREAPRTRIEGIKRGRVSLKVEGAEVQDVLWRLAEIGGVNLVIDDEVRGQMTLRLRDVAWADAFEAVLKANDLGAEVTGNIIRVAPIAELSQQMRQRADFEAASEQSAPLEVRVVPVDYAEPEYLIPMVEQLLSPRGTVSYDPHTRSLIIRDVKGSQALGF